MAILPDLEKLTGHVCELARDTGKFLLGSVAGLHDADIQEKGVHNYVTWVDRESENRIVEKLMKLLPGCGFIAEESPGLKPSEFTWIVDPLDGTTNFIHGVPLYCISIGLQWRNEMISGVIHEPNLGECFYTWRDAPSFMNGKEIRVSVASGVASSLFATGFPYYDYHLLDEYMLIFKHLLQNSRGARRLGSAAADLAYTACGRYDGFFEYGLSPWDVAAGIILVKNAGGVVTDFHGGNDVLFGKEIIATNPLIHGEFLELFRSWP